ncbi:hypothetical protein ELH05_25005 [Rhizobium ruizarguesonis]|uniref:hypothetical protein n=1 Tax=Rhizobium ruizarguesonis TaxID=2081791 RepID=UPI0010302BA9|nr:hypothetical protein [Rhizobium ruizarguesonis]TBE30862.1 hypothetical protein ELH05_25005 [Rhizobium ruizarguesonis]
MNTQRYYWETFSTLKRDQIYIGLLQEKLDHIERCLSILSAVSASGAIAGWALWQHIAFVWAIIIALSQVYGAVKNHLPFGARLKALHGLYPELESLALEAERGWFEVSRGTLSEDEIINLASSLKQRKITVTQKHLKDVLAPEKAKMVFLADVQAKAYLDSFTERDDETATATANAT